MKLKTRLMRKLLSTAILLIFILPNGLLGQSTITGQIKDQNNKAVELIEVQLQNKDSLIEKSDLTNAEGKFSITAEKGEYKLIVKQLGKVLHKENIIVTTPPSGAGGLGVITITQNPQQLKEVVVTNRKKLIERKVDRLVFNVENSIAATGGDAVDVLSMTPSLKVQDDKISIIGKSGVDVLVNNKKTQLSGDDLLTYLKSIKSENILKIEVITSPSAKYDADGNSGLVNIVLKKNPNMGLSGSAQSTTTKATYWSVNNGINLNYQDDKFKITWRGNLSNFKIKSLEYNKIETITQSIENNTDRINYGNNYGTSLSLEYKLSEKSNLGFVYNLSGRKINGNGETETLIKNSLIQKINSLTNMNSDGLVNTLNTYYNYNIDNNGKKMIIESNYITNNSDNTVDNISNSITYNNLQNIKNNNFKIKTLQIDFELPNEWCKIETGAKITITDSENKTIRIANNEPNASNLFSLNENINALYFTSSKEINKKWTTDLGLRYEKTILEIQPENDNKINISRYNLFPSFSVLFNQNENTSWTMSYTTRISRPNYNDLNPYKYYNNSFSYTTGNPYLMPAISHNVEFNYTHNNVNVSLYGSKNLSQSGSLSFIENDFQVNRIENYYNENSLGLNINYTYNFFKIWDTTLYADGHYDKSNSNVLQMNSFEGWNGYFSANNNIILNKNKTFVLFANFWQTTKNKTGYRTINPNSNFSIGFRYSLLDKKLQLSFTARDIFKQEYKNGFYNTGETNNTYNNYYDARKFILSLNYKFGSNKVKGNQKSTNNDEQNRTSIKE